MADKADYGPLPEKMNIAEIQEKAYLTRRGVIPSAAMKRYGFLHYNFNTLTHRGRLGIAYFGLAFWGTVVYFTGKSMAASAAKKRAKKEEELARKQKK